MNYKITISLLLFSLLAACNYLDYDDKSDLKEGDVFSQYENAERILIDAYSKLPSGYNSISNAMLSSGSDEAEHAYEYASIQSFNSGSWNQFSNPDDQYSNLYVAIRKVNLYLERSVGLDSVVKAEWLWVKPSTYYVRHWNLIFYEGEARFLRAFFYFELMKRYGGVPIVKNTVDVNSSMNLNRATIDEVLDLIHQDCQFAASVLLPSWQVKINNAGVVVTDPNAMDLVGRTGRVTKGAAYALLAKAYLYAASPLHNNGGYKVNYCDSAAKYAAKVMDMPEHKPLHTNYADLFKAGATYYKEMIFERRSGDNNAFEKYNYPVGYDKGGLGATCPSLNLFNAYEMKDGSAFDWNNPAHAANPFANRDARLNATFLYNDQTFKGRAVECWDDGLDGLNRERGTKTGFYLRKHVDESLDLASDKKSRHTWFFIRMADVYLMFAEAANQVNGSNSTLYGHIPLDRLNDVRGRGGNLPALVGITDPNVFLEKVRQERRVELAFEDARFWDVRRWQLGIDAFGSDLMGINVVKTETGFLYSPKLVEKRTFQNFMNLYPIPESEIIKTGMAQNSGW